MSSEFWSVVAISSFWGWVITFLLFIFKSFPRYGIFKTRPALIWGSASLLCTALWIIALRNA
jgi:hypothetical protein